MAEWILGAAAASAAAGESSQGREAEKKEVRKERETEEREGKENQEVWCRVFLTTEAHRVLAIVESLVGS